jgi:hypothetical protein
MYWRASLALDGKATVGRGAAYGTAGWVMWVFTKNAEPLYEKEGRFQKFLRKGDVGYHAGTILAIENRRVRLGVARGKNLARAINVFPAALVFLGWGH